MRCLRKSRSVPAGAGSRITRGFMPVLDRAVNEAGDVYFVPFEAVLPLVYSSFSFRVSVLCTIFVFLSLLWCPFSLFLSEVNPSLVIFFPVYTLATVVSL